MSRVENTEGRRPFSRADRAGVNGISECEFFVGKIAGGGDKIGDFCLVSIGTEKSPEVQCGLSSDSLERPTVHFTEYVRRLRVEREHSKQFARGGNSCAQAVLV